MDAQIVKEVDEKQLRANVQHLIAVADKTHIKIDVIMTLMQMQNYYDRQIVEKDEKIQKLQRLINIG